MLAHRGAEPEPHILVLGRVADLADDVAVQQELHGAPRETSAGGSRRSGSIASASQSGSSEQSSSAQRSSMAATRCARSARATSPSELGIVAVGVEVAASDVRVAMAGF